MQQEHIFSSFRDHSGFVFKDKATIFRQVNLSYKDNYDLLMQSGLYAELVKKIYLITHEEVNLDIVKTDKCYKILKPEQLELITYPYGWSFSMLKDAALLTLNVQHIAIKHGMILKDASAYNIQFIGSKPVFIDTLSFEKYQENTPWIAYGQFCKHFLAPLALMSYTDVSLHKLFALNIDGIPLDLTVKILPFRAKLNIGLYLHLFLHSKVTKQSEEKKIEKKSKKFSLKSVTQLTEHLRSTTKNLEWKPKGTEWDEYYTKSVGKDYFDEKIKIVNSYLEEIKPVKVMDLGANNGTFSKEAAKYAKSVLSFDIDTACVEQNYLALKKEKNTSITPLIVDLTNPEPAIGWNNKERENLFERVEVDTIMALALIHHLCISNNIPLAYLATFLADNCQNLIIEYVPKTDEKVQRLLQNRVDIFDNYTEKDFVYEFSRHFNVKKSNALEDGRILFLMTKHDV